MAAFPSEPRVFKRTINCKLVLLGESAVGKTCLAIRYVRRFYNEYEDSTVGAAFLTKIVDVGPYNIKLEIWDTAGAERFHILAPLYYRRAQAAVVVYDTTSRDSFRKAVIWLKEISMFGVSIPVVALVGNKSDLVNDRVVAVEDGLRLAEEHQLIFVETSAKTGHNVDRLFLTIAKRVPVHTIEVSNKITDDSFVYLSDDEPKRSFCCS